MASGSQNMTTFKAKGLTSIANTVDTSNFIFLKSTALTADQLGNTVSLSLNAAAVTGAAMTNHSLFLNAGVGSGLGTPFQLQIPDSSHLYIYKRWYSSSAWSDWSKISAGTADTWTTARTLTIGDTGKAVDGSANVSWSKDEILGASDSTKFYRGDKTWSNVLGGVLVVNAGSSTSQAEYVFNKSGTYWGGLGWKDSSTLKLGGCNQDGSWVDSAKYNLEIQGNTVALVGSSGTEHRIDYKFDDTWISQIGCTSDGTKMVWWTHTGSAWTQSIAITRATKAITITGDTTFNNIVHIVPDTDVGLNQNGSLIIGAKGGVNVALDGNEIMARNNGAASTLYVNSEGGNVYIGSGGVSSVGTVASTAGYLQSTLNGNTVQIGSQNGSYSHFTNSKDIPFWFNKVIQSDGGFTIYNTGANHWRNGYLQVNKSDGGDCYIEICRAANADWRILNSSGDLYFQSNWTTAKGSYFTVLQLDHSTGRAHFKEYVYASYFNASCGVETPADGSYWLFANSDGFFRKSSRANIAAKIDLEHKWVRIGGDTMSGDLLFSNSGTTTRQVRGIVGDNDYWRIAGGATAANAGWMEIATADDGNEPVYVRQYTGAYTTIKRTLTLLDASGDTTVPGSLYFKGAGIYHIGSAATYQIIRIIDSGDQYGTGISIGAGGLALFGSGESTSTVISNLSLTAGGTESTYITSDNSIEFYPSINGWDAAARIWMTAGVLNIGVDGNTTRENSLNVYSGAGRIQLYSAASATGNRGLWVPAHGSGSSKNIIVIDTNNNATFTGNVTGNCSGSSGSCTGNAATATNLVGISMTGGNGNTGGRRLIYTWTINAWSNHRLTFAVSSRHTGSGLVAVSVGCNSNKVSLANCYAEIKYFGSTDSGGIISATSYEIYINSAGTKAYLFWQYTDYNATSITPISGGLPSNGTWTENPASYGTLKAQTEINVANSVAWGNITGKPSTFAPATHNHDSTYVNVSGDTMTGSLTVNGINVNNNNITGINCLKFNDAAENFNEGIMFPNGSAFDCMAAYNGAFYFRCGTDGTPAVNSTNANGKVYAANFYGYFNGNCSGSAGSVAWANVGSKPATATRWPTWSEIGNGADGLSEATANWTDNTEILTSYASNNGFADTNAKGKVYRRDAVCAYNYIKDKANGTWGINITGSAGSVAWGNVTSKPGNYPGGCTGNAATATKATQDGDGNTIKSTYLKLSGGVMTGQMEFNNKGSCRIFNGPNDAINGVGGALNNLVIGSWYGVSFTTDCTGQTYTKKTAVAINCRNGNVYAARFNGPLTGDVTGNCSGSSGSCTGNAATATKLGTANKGDANHPIYLSGGTPYQCNYPHSGAWYSAVPYIHSDGMMEIGRYIDFHGTSNTTADHTIRLTCATNTARIDCNGIFAATGWSDLAEYRRTIEHEPGRAVISTDCGVAKRATGRLQPGARIVSDTYGFCLGESDDEQSPIALTGRVLAYPCRPISEYHAGDAVCSGPNGTVDLMTREEIQKYPDCIIGIVNEIPTYPIWNPKHTDDRQKLVFNENVEVRGRIWIDVK